MEGKPSGAFRGVILPTWRVGHPSLVGVATPFKHGLRTVGTLGAMQVASGSESQRALSWQGELGAGSASARAPRPHRRGGFTLLELLVVIVIIGLLAGLVAPRYFDQVSKTNTKIARAQIDSLEKALDQYRLDVGSYPTTEAGLAALNTRPQNLERWSGPYLRKAVPPDPWGAPYVYKSPGDHGDYDLQSLGSDGQPGGTGEAADVTSWGP
jgi:general secretion pathway protein G